MFKADEITKLNVLLLFLFFLQMLFSCVFSLTTLRTPIHEDIRSIIHRLTDTFINWAKIGDHKDQEHKNVTMLLTTLRDILAENRQMGDAQWLVNVSIGSVAQQCNCYYLEIIQGFLLLVNLVHSVSYLTYQFSFFDERNHWIN